MRRCRPLLGTFVEIECDRAEAIDAGFAAIERVHRLMSAHEIDSDVSRINRFGHIRPVEVHEWTARVIERALFWSTQSEGAFDIVRAGRSALEKGVLPRHADQPTATVLDCTSLQIQGPSVRLLKSACLDLGGIAKGFAVDCAVGAVCSAGCETGVVNAGGDLRAFGPQAHRISILEPATRMPILEYDLRDSAMATSAGLIDGRNLTFDHLVDARSDWTSVTVVSAKACDADALTKIVWSLGRQAAPLLAEQKAKAFAICADGSVEPVVDQALAA